MKNNFIKILLLLLVSPPIFSVEYTRSEHKDKDIGSIIVIERSDGFVRDASVAIKIAEVLLVSNYGEEVNDKKPFKAELVEDGTVWLITGTFHRTEAMYSTGGIPYIKISKKDGRIIGYIHTK
ncbi:MAG: YbbC/YhhH family protein [Spirochaetaceae bacterium]